MKRSALKILIIEDDFGIRVVLQDSLTSLGFDIMAASNGREGFERLKLLKEKPDLVILDMMMPVMTGSEFLELKQKDSDLAKIPVLAISVNHTIQPAAATGFLNKPFDLDRLLDAIETCVAPKRAG